MSEPEDVSPRLRHAETNLARLDERLKSLATHEDVASIKVWFLVTAVVLVVGVATVAAAIAH